MIQKKIWFYTLIMFGLISCGGSDKSKQDESSNTQSASSFFQLRADVAGLDGTLILSNNGKHDVTIQHNGVMTFPATWSQEGNYEIKVMEEPCAQRCVIDKPRGQIGINGLLTLSVSCTPKTWEYPLAGNQSLSLPNTDADSPKVTMNKYGDMLLAWKQSNFYNSQLYMKNYENRKWDELTSITNYFSFAGSDVDNFSLDLNDSNEGSVVWTQGSDIDRKIYIGDLSDLTWEFPASVDHHINIGNVTANTLSPVVRVNSLGEKIVVWAQSAGSNVRLYKAEYRNGSWTFPANLNENINPDGTDVTAIDAAIDNLGNIIIVWKQSDGNYESIFKSEYRNGVWTHPLTLPNDITMPGTDAYDPKVVMNDVGDAYITWFQDDDATTHRYQIFVAEYHNGIWDVPTSLSDNISPNGEHSKYPRIALNNQGQVVIAFAYRYDDSDDDYQVAVQRKSTGETWTSPTILTTSNATESPSRIALDMDDQENILVAWSLQNTGQVYKAEYRNNHWLKAVLSEPINFNPAVYDTPSVAVNHCRAALAWQQENDAGTTQIYFAQYH